MQLVFQNENSKGLSAIVFREIVCSTVVQVVVCIAWGPSWPRDVQRV